MSYDVLITIKQNTMSLIFIKPYWIDYRLVETDKKSQTALNNHDVWSDSNIPKEEDFAISFG